MKLIKSDVFARVLAFTAVFVACSAASAQSLSTTAVELLGNTGVYAGNVSAAINSSSVGAPVSASLDQSFLGNDESNNPRLMNFTGYSYASSEYGKLHVKATGSIENSYYNSANPNYAGTYGSIADPSGSPDSLSSLTFANFTDTFNYSGAAASGDTAVYVFRLSGYQNYDVTNPGMNVLADLDLHVDGYSDQGFFEGGAGSINDLWISQAYAISPSGNITLSATLSNQTVFNTFAMPDGTNTSATSEFSHTLDLAGIVVFDANGNIIPTSQWGVSSASGTGYNQLNAVPEPSGLVLIAGLAILALIRRNR